MEFEWDEMKRLRTLEKHGLEFHDVSLVFSGRYLTMPAREVFGETRLLLIGQLEGMLVTIIYTARLGKIRIITMRRARHDEQRRYQAIYGG